MHQIMRGVMALLLCVIWQGDALAANKPCSGKKGGVALCSKDGAKFICRDGTVSSSKKRCRPK